MSLQRQVCLLDHLAPQLGLLGEELEIGEAFAGPRAGRRILLTLNPG